MNNSLLQKKYMLVILINQYLQVFDDTPAAGIIYEIIDAKRYTDLDLEGYLEEENNNIDYWVTEIIIKTLELDIDDRIIVFEKPYEVEEEINLKYELERVQSSKDFEDQDVIDDEDSLLDGIDIDFDWLDNFID